MADRGGRVAGPARLLALAVDDRAVLVAVLLDETHLAAEFTGDGPDLDFDFSEVFVAFMADQRRTGHQRNHLLQVAQHVHLLDDRHADGELVGDLHTVVPGVAVFDERVADQGAIVGRLGQCPKARQRRIDRIGRGNICDAQRHQSRYPVDGLGHAGRLVQVKITRAAHELGGMLDQRCRRPGHRPADNRGRPEQLRVIDPMVEAAPPQCVV